MLKPRRIVPAYGGTTGWYYVEDAGVSVLIGETPSDFAFLGQVSYLRFGLILRTSRGWPSDKRLFTTVGSSA